MKKITRFSKITALLIGLFLSSNLYAQVGIGTIFPDTNSLLELDASITPGGLRLPRLNLTNTAAFAPLAAHVEGMFVYNTATAGDVTPGVYYNTGLVWVRVNSTTPTNDWALAGNTIAAANFLGTINGLDLNIRTTNLERMRVQANGQVTVGSGAAAAIAGDQFTSTGLYAVNGYATNGFGLYGLATTGLGSVGLATSGSGVFGQATTGNGVEAYSASSGDAVHSEHDGSGNAVDAVAYGTGVGVYAENYFWSDYAMHAVDGVVSVFADNTTIGFDAMVADTDDTISNSLWARNFNAAGTAVLGSSNNLSVFSPSGSGLAGSGTKLGVFGYAGAGTTAAANRGNAAGAFTLDTDSNPSSNGTNNGTRASAKIAGFDNVSPNGVLAAQNSYFGGYFVGGNHDAATGNPSYAYAGMKWNANVNGINGTNYKIIGNGSVSTLIKDSNNLPRIMFAPEAPEILFEDYGTGKLVNGTAQISIDPILKNAIYVDEKHPLKVFIQLEGDCNGVFVTNKSSNGFTVKELANGTSNVSFSYHIVANRADDIDANGEIASKHVGLRLPIGPGPLKEPELAVRKEGDNKVGKDLSSKKRPERKDKVKKEEVKSDSEKQNLSSEK